MKRVITTIFCLIFMMLVGLPYSIAQEGQGGIEMAETIRSEGKIYVVVMVVVILFTGLVLFAFNTDRKLRKVEKEVESLKSGKDS